MTPLLHVALWEPEIPPNAGNVARLCAANGLRLHLIGRLGFRLDDKSLKRAGLDYWPHVDWVLHPNLAAFEAAVAPARVWAVENPAPRSYTAADFAAGDVLLFGSESRGLPPEARERHAGRLVDIPMRTAAVRSLNLATAVGVVAYEALRRIG